MRQNQLFSAVVFTDDVFTGFIWDDKSQVEVEVDFSVLLGCAQKDIHVVAVADGDYAGRKFFASWNHSSQKYELCSRFAGVSADDMSEEGFEALLEIPQHSAARPSVRVSEPIRFGRGE